MASKRRFSERDRRLVAALTVLRDQLGPVVDELNFGELDAETRRELACGLRLIADDLDPAPVVLVEVDQCSDMTGGLVK